MDLDNLPPWDQIPYFQTPSITKVGGVSFSPAVTLIAPADPQRVVLVFSLVDTTNNVIVSPSSSVGNTGPGLLIVPNAPILTITQAEWGALVNAAWYAFISQTQNINVLTLSLKEWPNERTIVKSSPLRQPNRSNRRSRFNPIAPPE